ncbi:MAG: tetratricopeptide repeat protein [Verrucomicrobiae bacterium]|nr:tetratricopeptide repeat protein [Verrucomicrobiae bacterium]
MSQSPVDNFSPENVLRYEQGWKALNRLLHEDRSFSGHEKNCAYLNTGGGNFADASFATGLNFPDDGRGVALVDWDFDGDLDFWTTNRTAPRVRFMKNTTAPGKAFVTVRLEGNGKTTNRDAIGARLRLFIKGEAAPRVRSLRTSEGFLSMSSNWIHFGLGKATAIDRLEVDWPGGSTETVTGVEPGQFYLVRQGTGIPERWTRPAGIAPLAASEPELPQESDTSRAFLAARLQCPVLPIKENGTARELDKELNGPVLINLWASWCAPCIAELSEWSREADRITASGLRIIALNTDSLDPDMGKEGEAAALLKKVNFPFDHFDAQEQAVQNLNLLQRAVLDRWLPLPVPSSFLLDQRGYVAAVYRGPVGVNTLLQDVKNLNGSPEALRAHALPFPGLWSHEQATASPLGLATQFVDFSQPDEALNYLRRYISTGGGSHLPESERRSHHADILYVLGALLEEDEQADAALKVYEEAAALNPDDLRIRASLGRLSSGSGQLDEAEKQLREALRINPDDGNSLRMLALALAQGEKYAEAAPYFKKLVDAQPKDDKLALQYATVLDRANLASEAIEQYKRVLGLNPKAFAAANGIARIRASHPDASLRNGQEAVILGQRLCQVTGNQHAGYLDTLAMAYAELGKFDQALETLRIALELQPNDPTLLAHRSLFEAGKAIRGK